MKGPVGGPVTWVWPIHLLIKTSKTRKMLLNFWKPLQPVSIQGVNENLFWTNKYLVFQPDDKLECSTSMDVLYRSGQSQLGSFNIHPKLLQMFQQTVVTGILFYAVSGTPHIWTNWLGRLALWLEQGQTPLFVADRRTFSKMLSIKDNVHHPVDRRVMDRKVCSVAGWCLSRAKQLFNSSPQGRGKKDCVQNEDYWTCTLLQFIQSSFNRLYLQTAQYNLIIAR